jgi:hypothetical protein
MPRKTDAEVKEQGSLSFVFPLTPRARSWVKDRVDLDGYPWTGKNSFSVEAQYVGNVIAGMRAAGLVVRV